FTPIPSLPLTPSGKLDRKRLPEPVVVSRTSETLGPATEIERELLGFWRKFLKNDSVGVEDDFFVAGGHSILGTQMINAISRHYHLSLPIRLLFEKPTVRALALALSEFEDEAWLEESKTAASLLTRSHRRLLENLPELAEEELDEFLDRHLEDPRLSRFDDVAALLAWAKEEEGAAATERRPRKPAASTSAGSERLETGEGRTLEGLYLSTFYGLARTRATLEGLLLRGGAGEAASAATGSEDGRQHLARSLEAEGVRIFEDYVRSFKSHLACNGNGAPAPGELRSLCGQMLNLAYLAAVFRAPREESHAAEK
ncbi:MAG: hypothetical protein KDD47_28090, partial [Acidobacteria bacterium]|nr:hypothetical protein [Acidobacteriota bacterium]